MRVLVTGGAGFIGSHVVELLLKQGHTPVVLDDLSHGRSTNLPSEVEVIVGDIRDRDLAKRAMSGVQAVAHLAAHKSVVGSMRDPHFDAEVNILGTINLLSAAAEAGTTHFVLASTGGALYGETDGRPTVEAHPTHPKSPYGLSKLAAEGYLGHFSRQVGMVAVNLRMANVYGPRQDGSGEGGVVAIYSQKALSGDPVDTFGDGEQTRDYVYVEDVAEAFLIGLTTKESATVNIGTAIETTVNQLAREIESITGRQLNRTFQPAREGEIRNSSLDIALAERQLGWRPRHSLIEGLAKTVAWFRATSA